MKPRAGRRKEMRHREKTKWRLEKREESQRNQKLVFSDKVSSAGKPLARMMETKAGRRRK